MITSHQLAKALLEKPDLPIFVPKVKEYSDDDDSCCVDPLLGKHLAYNHNGAEVEIYVISYSDKE